MGRTYSKIGQTLMVRHGSSCAKTVTRPYCKGATNEA